MQRYVLPLLAGVLLAAVLLPLDAPVARNAQSVRDRLGGDALRTVETLQQYGDLATTLIVAVTVFLLDPARRRRLLDLALGWGLAALACLALKIALGRPRPGRGGDWLLWHGLQWPLRSRADFWSMPSSHTAAAMALSVFLVALYPRIRPLAAAMVVIVALGRVLTGAHYPSDLAIGAAIGYVAATLAVREQWGVRLVDQLGRKTH